MTKQLSKSDLFLQLAQPDQNGVSRWVYATEFTGRYERLKLGNGCDFARKSSSLAKRFIIKFDKSITQGNSIDAIKLDGFKQEETFNQTIRKDIRDIISKQRCVMLGVRGFSENTTIEVDHKDGRKDDWKVSNPSTQRLEDFQPLCKAANDVKREICKRCRTTDKRWDAKNLAGNPYSFYAGDEDYTGELGCVGCYQYDPVAYRVHSCYRIFKETSRDLFSRLYPDLDLDQLEKFD